MLQKVAALLPSGSFIITSRSAETVTAWRGLGWLSELVDTTDSSSISSLLKRYESLSLVIDSIPPQDFSSPDAFVEEAGARISTLAALERAIYLSTTGVYGVEDGSWVDEHTPCKAALERPRARVAFEKIYRNNFKIFTTLRIPAIYGPGRGIGHSLKERRYPLIENGERWSNRIHVEDLARAIVMTISLPQPPQVICVSDAEPARSIDLVNFYCSKFNLPFPVSISIEEAKRRGLHTMVSNQRVSSKFLREALGLKLQFPTYREGAASEIGLPQL